MSKNNMRTARYNTSCIKLQKGRKYIADYVKADERFGFCTVCIFLALSDGSKGKQVFQEDGFLENDAKEIVRKFNNATENGSKEW